MNKILLSLLGGIGITVGGMLIMGILIYCSEIAEKNLPKWVAIVGLLLLCILLASLAVYRMLGGR